MGSVPGAKPEKRLPLNEENIAVAVVVEIEYGDATSGGFQDVIRPRWQATNVCEVKAGSASDITEVDRRRLYLRSGQGD